MDTIWENESEHFNRKFEPQNALAEMADIFCSTAILVLVRAEV